MAVAESKVQKVQKSQEEIQKLKNDLLAQRLQKKEEKRLAKVQKTVEQYPHADISTLNKEGNKWFVNIKCIECGSPRRVQVQDLFHVKLCANCKTKAKTEKK